MSHMPIVILCGGQGTRFREETQFRPKPLIQIGEYPILWHVMNIYVVQGFTNFILCLGYKGSMIKEYFLNYRIRSQDFWLQLGEGIPTFLDNPPRQQWRVTFAETGLTAMTGSRLKRIEKYVDSEHLMVTYADCVADIDIRGLIDFHLSHGKIGTVTGVRPFSPFGELMLDGSKVIRFSEKPQFSSVVNGGFFVFRREIFKYLDDKEDCILEREPLGQLVADGELYMYQHKGFWQCLDTYKDQIILQQLWESGSAPWTRSE